VKKKERKQGEGEQTEEVFFRREKRRRAVIEGRNRTK
jgi:hypothetical protein